MKSPGAIRQKLKQATFRYLKARIEASLRRTPPNCRHNGRIAQDGSPLHICLYGSHDPATWTGRVCDENHGGVEVAAACPFFVQRRTKDEVKAEFRQELDQMTLPQIAFSYPDLAALMWVLDEETAVEGDPEEVVSDIAPDATVPETTPSTVRVEAPAGLTLVPVERETTLLRWFAAIVGKGA